MVGLGRTPTSAASLLLNLERVATVVLAWFFFHEGIERRMGWGMARVLAGCVAPTSPWEMALSGLAGPFAVARACALWGLENNFTQGLAVRDPLLVAGLKGFAGGTFNGFLSVVTQQEFPRGGYLGAAPLVGFLGYGLSLAFFVFSLHRLGTARTAALFSLVPFTGVGFSFALLGDAFTHSFGIGRALVAAGHFQVGVGQVQDGGPGFHSTA